MHKNQELTYSGLDENARFREQFRLTFAGAIVATAFIVPDMSILTDFLRLFLGISALLSAIFLIFSAARVKCFDSGHVYQVLYVTERSRMRMFDWSVDVFGFAFLCFISILTVGLIEKAMDVRFNNHWSWLVFITVLVIEGFAAYILGNVAKSRESIKKLPEV